MKKLLIMLVLASLLRGLPAFSEELVPVPAGGKEITQPADDVVTYQYNTISLSEIKAFYGNLFKDDETISWQNPKRFKGLLINDWGSKKWHCISVVDKGPNDIEITVMRDSWTWIIGSLAVRFVGVLIVLSILMVALYLSGSLFKMGEDRKKAAG